jgi:hypothetical protein
MEILILRWFDELTILLRRTWGFQEAVEVAMTLTRL